MNGFGGNNYVVVGVADVTCDMNNNSATWSVCCCTRESVSHSHEQFAHALLRSRLVIAHADSRNPCFDNHSVTTPQCTFVY